MIYSDHWIDDGKTGRAACRRIDRNIHR